MTIKASGLEYQEYLISLTNYGFGIHGSHCFREFRSESFFVTKEGSANSGKFVWEIC